MASPSSSLSTLRPDLAASMEEFNLMADRQGFIAQQVAPIVNVAKPSGTFGKIPIEQLLQQRDTLRAPGGGYSRGKFTFTPSSFVCVEHGAEEVNDDREAAMYAEFLAAEMYCTQRALDAVLRNAEMRMAALIFNATTWTGASLTTGITHEWDDAANAVPVTDVEAACQKVYDNSGLWPNALIVNRKVFRNLRLCSQIQNLVKYQGFQDARAGAITAAAMAQAFDLDRIIIAGSPKNTAKEGQSASLSPIWSDEYAMVCRVAETADAKEPCIARTFHWSEDGSDVGGTIEQYRDEAVRGDVIRARHDVDEVVMYVEAGYLLSNVTT